MEQRQFTQWKLLDEFTERDRVLRPLRLHSLQGVLDLWRIERADRFLFDPFSGAHATNGKERGKTLPRKAGSNTERPISNSEQRGGSSPDSKLGVGRWAFSPNLFLRSSPAPLPANVFPRG